jgi:hypothetical protein
MGDFRMAPLIRSMSSSRAMGIGDAFVFGGNLSILTVETYHLASAIKGSLAGSLLAADSNAGGMSACGGSAISLTFGGTTNGSVQSSVVSRFSFATGARGANGAALSSPRMFTMAAGDLANAFTWGGEYGTGTNFESYSFASLGASKGAGAYHTTYGMYRGTAASSLTAGIAFVFGGGISGESWLLGTPGSKGAVPAYLTHASTDICSASDNDTQMLIFDGDGSTGGNSGKFVDRYLFASGVIATMPALLSTIRAASGPGGAGFGSAAAAVGCATNALVFGGGASPSVVDQFFFSDLTTRGASPASLSIPRGSYGCAAAAAK